MGPPQSNSATVAICERGSQLASVRELFREYAQSLEISLSFQGFERELATLPGRYALPFGCL